MWLMPQLSGAVRCLYFLAICAVVALVPHRVAAEDHVAVDDNVPTPELHRLGLENFADSCSICLGSNGEGDGALASEFTPPPRDLTFGSFKFQSTGFREPPARADWGSVIRNGIEGSYGRLMPAFNVFTDSEVLAVVEVVRQFAGLDVYGKPLEIPPRRANFSEVRARHYHKFGLECSGVFQAHQCRHLGKILHQKRFGR